MRALRRVGCESEGRVRRGETALGERVGGDRLSSRRVRVGLPALDA